MLIKKDLITHNKHHTFGRIHSWITNDVNLSDGAYRLYIILWNAKDTFNPTVTGLGTLMGIKKRQVINRMNELRKLGYIHTDGANNYTTIYVHPYPKVVQNITSKVVQDNAHITTINLSLPTKQSMKVEINKNINNPVGYPANKI